MSKSKKRVVLVTLGLLVYLAITISAGIVFGGLYSILFVAFLALPILAVTVIKILRTKRIKEWRNNVSFRRQFSKLVDRQLSHLRWRVNKSSLKRKTLYNFPLYLVIGEAQDEKEFLLKNNGATISLSDARDDIPSWYLANEAYLVDIPNHFGDASNEATTRFDCYLRALKRARRYRPWNGIVIVISAKDALTGRWNPAYYENILNKISQGSVGKVAVHVVITGAEVDAAFASIVRAIDESDKNGLLGAFVTDSGAGFKLELLKKIETLKLKSIESARGVDEELFLYGESVREIEKPVSHLERMLKDRFSSKFVFAGAIVTLQETHIKQQSVVPNVVFARKYFSEILRNPAANDENVRFPASRYKEEGSLLILTVSMATFLIYGYFSNSNRIDEVNLSLSDSSKEKAEKLLSVANYVDDLENATVFSKILYAPEQSSVRNSFIQKSGHLIDNQIQTKLTNALTRDETHVSPEKNREVLIAIFTALSTKQYSEKIAAYNKIIEYIEQPRKNERVNSFERLAQKYLQYAANETDKTDGLDRTLLVFAEGIVKKDGLKGFLSENDNFDREFLNRDQFFAEIDNLKSYASMIDMIARVQDFNARVAEETYQGLEERFVAIANAYIRAIVINVGYTNGVQLIKNAVNGVDDHLLVSRDIVNASKAVFGEAPESRSPAVVETASMILRLNDESYVEELNISEPDKTFVDKLKSAGKDALTNTSSVERKNREIDKKFLPAMKVFLESLKDVARGGSMDRLSYEMVNTAYTETIELIGESKSAMNLNVQAYRRIAKLVEESARQRDMSLFSIFEGYQKQLFGLMEKNTVNYLNDVWKEEVLMPYSDETGWKKLDLIKGDKGAIWEFQKKYLANFLVKKNGRYVENEKYGRKISINAEIKNLINQREGSSVTLKPTYQIKVFTFPTDVNREALDKPYLTKVTVNCAGENIELINENYPTSKSVQWKPNECGDVLLEIDIGKTKLEKRYTGYYGFIDFLKEYRNGQRLYQSTDFGSQRETLDRLKINNIAVNYRFEGINDLLKLNGQTITNIPKMIVEL